MESKKARLDRFVATRLGINRRDVRVMLAKQRITVDGEFASRINKVIDQFSAVCVDGESLQDNQPIYLMMNKPVGVVSATKDDQHKTVIDLLNTDEYADLHIVGRLDLNSSGLLLLTNHGEWSRSLTSPEKKVSKVYEVRVEKPVNDECIRAFAEGIYFPFEDITTLPAGLEKLSDTLVRVSLMEGKYHQIKRMFGRFRNPVLALHRVSIGSLQLDSELQSGDSRELTADEIERLSMDGLAVERAL